MELTEKTLNVLKEESEDAIRMMAEGKSAIEIAGEIYCKALPNKDAETGRVMAKRIDSILCEYESGVKSALGNSDAWINSQIDKQLENKELEERCKTLFAMLIGVSSLNDVLAGKKSAEEIQREYSFDVNNVSEEYESSLREHLIAAVKASAYGEYQLRALGKALESGKDGVAIGDVIDYGKHEHDVKVIMTMITYVNAKNGSIEEMPADVYLDEVAVAVASAYDAAAAAEQVEEGRISAEMGAKIVKAISTVASFMIAAVLAAATLWSAGSLINLFLPRIIGIPIIIIAALAFWGLFNETAKKCIDVITKIGGKVVKDGYAIVKNGAKKLTSFICESVVPKAYEAWNKVKAYFAKLKEESMEASQEENAEVRA